MGSWQTKALGEVCDVIGGGTPAKDRPEFYGGNIPWATVRDMGSDLITSTEFKITPLAVQSSATNTIPKNNVIIATRVGLGKVCLVQADTAINQDLRAIIPKNAKQLCVPFVFWWLKSVAHLIVAEGTGATVQGVKLPFIKSLRIPLPPLPEQRRIVAILDEAFAGLATATANAEKNFKNARELFDSCLNLLLHEKRMSWPKTTLRESCEYANGKAHERHIDKNGRFIVINSKFISSKGEVIKRSNHALSLLEPGSIAMVLSDVPNGSALASCYLVDEKNLYTLNQRICSIHSRRFDPRFLYYQLNRNSYFLAFDNGENQTNLRLGQVLDCPLYLPDISEQKAIAQSLHVVRAETEKLESNYQNKLASLHKLRQSIFHKAFRGGFESAQSLATPQAAE